MMWTALAIRLFAVITLTKPVTFKAVISLDAGDRVCARPKPDLAVRLTRHTVTNGRLELFQVGRSHGIEHRRKRCGSAGARPQVVETFKAALDLYRARGDVAQACSRPEVLQGGYRRHVRARRAHGLDAQGAQLLDDGLGREAAAE